VVDKLVKVDLRTVTMCILPCCRSHKGHNRGRGFSLCDISDITDNP
jgi:hypothetical protein